MKERIGYFLGDLFGFFLMPAMLSIGLLICKRPTGILIGTLLWLVTAGLAYLIITFVGIGLFFSLLIGYTISCFLSLVILGPGNIA
jgi:hypothetical protein